MVCAHLPVPLNALLNTTLLGASFLGANLAAITALTPAAGHAQAGITGPAPGVLCDQAGPICYDRQGPSIGLTQTYFGSIAAERLMGELRNRPALSTVRLSNGAVCDLPAATCWSDGWDRRQVNGALTNQLFGNSGGGSGGGGSGNQIRAAQCRMTRWFKTLYNGGCDLRENRSNRGRLLEVNLQDGNLYSISRPRGGSYQISDRNGATWPVQVNDQGRTISFSWSDRVLTVTPQVAPSSGNSLLQLINSLLSY